DCYPQVEQFRSASGAIVDAFIRCKYSSYVANRWLAIRLEFIGNLVIFFAALFAVISKELGWVTSPGIIGVSISYALNITEVLNFAIRQISEIEANIVAVERIDEYTNTPTEGSDIQQAKHSVYFDINNYIAPCFEIMPLAPVKLDNLWNIT
ncbi:hypothetical protein TELCIR_05879, partial [Teladorsagia circumcincta]